MGEMMKLGRVRSIPDKRTLKLANYLSSSQLAVAQAQLPQPPDENFKPEPPDHVWPMLANDRYPCCTSAAAGHMVHHWTELNGHEVLLTEDDIVNAHLALSKVSDSQATKDGISMLEALKYWRKTGIGGHKIHSFVQANPMSRRALRSMVYLFGSAYLGLELPNFAYPVGPSGPPPTLNQIPWEIPAAAPDADTAPREANGHCVAAVGYDQNYVYVVTWGKFKQMSWQFFENYTFESYAVLSHDWADGCRKCPSGFDIHSLEQDLGLVSARPTQ